MIDTVHSLLRGCTEHRTTESPTQAGLFSLLKGGPHMPRVVPTQVVPFIAARFAWAIVDDNTPVIIERGEVRALVRLVERIPEELLILAAAEDAALVVAVSG